MRETDLPAFQQIFARMATVFGKKTVDDGLMPAYFRVLQGCEFIDVSRAADALLASEKFFPKPAQWLQAAHETQKGEPIQAMSGAEASEWIDAERRGYEADPCTCRECVEAGVADKPRRFVPTEDRFGAYEKRLLGTREVLRGHWEHGFDLARWYQARAAFYEVAWRLKLGNPLAGEGAKSMEPV